MKQKAAVLALCFTTLIYLVLTVWAAVSDAAGRREAPVAMAVVLSCVNAGWFLSPYLTNASAGILGDGGPASDFCRPGSWRLCRGRS